LGEKRFELKTAAARPNLPKLRCAESAEQWWMNVGRTAFSQLIAHLSHIEFQKCVARYDQR
jgi:hypothetical protein